MLSQDASAFGFSLDVFQLDVASLNLEFIKVSDDLSALCVRVQLTCLDVTCPVHLPSNVPFLSA